jgi:lipopolysaccharide export system permease protein
MRARLMIRYVLSEMIPTFFIGVIVFVFVLLMFQALRLTEYVLIHGVKLSTVALIMGYLSTSFLPVLFPMSLLFSVLLTYGRLSSDAEIVAFRASGLSMISIVSPALILSVLIGVLSLQTSFHIAPWGNRQFELLITKVGSTKPAVSLKEGTFADGFFDMVIYANHVDSKTGLLSQVFIYDERDAKAPLTVIANEGQIVQDPNHPGESASIRLSNGSVHRTSDDRHTKIDFSTYDIFLSAPSTEEFRNKSPQSLTIEELDERIDPNGSYWPKMKTDQRLELETEKHKRIAIAFACVLFALIGVGLGTTSNRRNVRSGGTVVCIGLIIAYYVLYVVCEGAARQGQIPPMIAMWIANVVFSGAAWWSLKRIWD